jgi:hypothetical protein
MMEGQGGDMRKGDKVKVAHWTGKFDVPVFHPESLGHLGYIPHGDLVEVVRMDLMGPDNHGLASVGWTGDAEVIHPQIGRCLVEQAYLEVV